MEIVGGGSQCANVAFVTHAILSIVYNRLNNVSFNAHTTDRINSVAAKTVLIRRRQNVTFKIVRGGRDHE